MQKIAILGSTGSIGRQTIEVVVQHPDQFEVYALSANNNWQLLVEQALQYKPEVVVIANEQHYACVKEALKDELVKVYAGVEALNQVVSCSEITTVVMALVGFSGLAPTVCAIKAGKRIALANKETLVVAGEQIMALAQNHRVPLLPIDSEHSAIFQCLTGEGDEIEKIILTASGGPFREFTKQQIALVTPAQALKHPNWTMGQKITIDSATLMNKGLEVIEARWLFGLAASQIEVLVHPQSIVHSMVQFRDGAIKAQLGSPDMKIPIQYALSFPQRLPLAAQRLDLLNHTLSFEKPDTDRFPCLAIAYNALERGGNIPCVMNAANEVAVNAFLDGVIAFPQIHLVVASCMDQINYVPSPALSDYSFYDKQSREMAWGFVKGICKK